MELKIILRKEEKAKNLKLNKSANNISEIFQM